MNLPETKDDGKMELVAISSELMPKGEPNLLGVIVYPTIEKLCQEHGKKSLRLAITLLVKDLCNSLNVVRNMNEDQIIEAACMLLDECGDFRLEDYVMMFSLAKRGQLVKIMDRVDIDLIGEMMDVYWLKRHEAGKRFQEQQHKDYENKLKELEREKPTLTEGEKIIQDKYFESLKDLAKKLSYKSVEQQEAEDKEKDERIKKHQDFFRQHMTPEQIQEAEEKRIYLMKMSEEFEKNRK